MELEKSYFLIGLIVLLILISLLVIRLLSMRKNYAKTRDSLEVLQNDKNQFVHMLNSVNDVIFRADDQGLFTYINDTIENLLGYQKDEIIGKRFQDLIHDSDLDRIKKAYYEHYEENKKQSDHEFLAKRKDGSTLWVGQKVTSIFNKDNPNKIDGFYGVVRDINDKKEAILRLSKEEKTLRLITETLNDVFYLFNIESNSYEYISTNSETILGTKNEVFYQKKNYINSIIVPEDMDISDAGQILLRKGIPYNIDFRISVENEIKWINEKSFPILGKNGAVVAHTGILRDITNIKKAQEVIDDQTAEINSSIQYAKGIQEAVLPNSEQFSDVFKDAFVYFNPKDTVSGDFYIIDILRTNKQMEMPALIVGDCTGHGVPGAVLSLMCNVLVRESFSRQEVNSPAEALDFVRNRLIAFLCSQSDHIINDGMDISFCVLNKKESQMYFSGAYMSCIIVRNGTLIEYKGDRQHVGYITDPQPFQNHIIDIEKGDCIYLFTDGYADQFGGDRNKKFSKKRLHQLLLDSSHLPMKDIALTLENEFNAWQREYFQIDDVTVLGIRID